jgi:group 2 family glycosyl transferase
MAMEYAVSVIVPIYKAENYLHRCIDSILAQSFQNFQLVLVDDGSPDKSGEICDDYALLDSRIEVIHKVNGGVMSSRKCGIEHAKGVYSIQFDPDDWVEPTLLEDLYLQAVRENADMVICDVLEHCNRKTTYLKQEPTLCNNVTVMKDMFSKLMGSTCNKLIKTSNYTKYHVQFYEDLVLLEDLFLMFQLLLNPLKISYVNKALYHYERNLNQNSITMTKGERFKGYADSICKRFRKLLSPHPVFWNLWVEKEMPWIAYLSLYYNAFDGKRYFEEFSFLRAFKSQNLNDRLVRLALYNYPMILYLIRLKKVCAKMKIMKK